ncbi:MAG TPA: SRPBCC family protein [bacterium]|nr:SRPBCC family protein [bacterium]
MKRIFKHEVILDCPIARAFRYTTTMGHWPEWHPATQSVAGQTKKPGKAGDRVREKLRTAMFFSGTIDWKVVSSKPPRDWSLQTVTISLPLLNRARVRIDYHFSPEGKKKTRLTRLFRYDLPASLILLDAVYLRFKMESESQEALRRLQGSIRQP